MVNIIDPVTSTQISVMGQFYYMIATMVFMAVDGHHLLLRAVADSFNVIPLGQAHFSAALGTKMMEIFSQSFFHRLPGGGACDRGLVYNQYGLGGSCPNGPPNERLHRGHAPQSWRWDSLFVAISMSFFVYILQGFHGTLP